MTLNDALRRYQKGLFGDQDVTTCTGLSVRAWRELIKVGAAYTITDIRGRGRVRLCDATTFKRAAIIAALNRAGLSLAMAGRLAYFLPADELLYALWDPCNILLDISGIVDPVTGLPPRLARPKTDWFDPDRPAKADPENDWRVEIFDGRFVGITTGIDDEPAIHGDLRDDGTTFVCWLPFHQHTKFAGYQTKAAEALLPRYKIGDLIAKWQQPHIWSDRLHPKFLDYHFEEHTDDPLVRAAVAAAQSPVSKTTVNISLAIRKALRRYLDIEPAAETRKG